MRQAGRATQQLRPVSIELAPLKYPEGSTLIRMGNTWVLCAITVQHGVPRWRQGTGQGWLTAEYALLPRSTQERTSRQHIQGGRAQEIRRLIGRSLRRAVDFSLLHERTILVDCDVLQADGGTRTAAITGGYVAVALAINQLLVQGKVPPATLKEPLAAVSAGIVNGELLLDLDYSEDSQAQVDLNVVMDADGGLIEVQGTAEGAAIPRARFDELLTLTATGVQTLIRLQREVLATVGVEF
ncbi:MAG: ribonuclease PH [Chloroflexota bacterium]|nr:ribonuclease PH [Chloroflexota bacterium]